MVAASKYANAAGIIKGGFKKDGIPSEINAQVVGHPLGFFLDIQQLVKNIDPNIVSSSRDSTILAESKKLLKSISINGGSFKDNSFESHLDINFTNTEENSIFALMDYGLKVGKADKMGQ